MKRSLRRLSCLIGAFALTAALAVAYGPAAHAEPSTPPAIAWSQLGLSNEIELVGANQPSDVNMPVPQGVMPVQLTGQIGSAVNTTGRIDILDVRGVLIASIPIPADLASVPFTVDIAQAQVDDGVAKLTFLIRDYNDQRTDSCVLPRAVTLSQLAATYSGASPAPGTVADFLPGYLDQITVRVGSDPSLDQQQAALTLVAKLTHLYRPMPVRIDVDTSSSPSPQRGGATQRTIVIREADEPGLVVENPGRRNAVLAITGRGPDLLQQVELFADRRFDLAQTPSASVTSANTAMRMSSDTKTFGELGMTPHGSVIGTTTLYVGFDAAAFGVGSIDRATVNLIAHYTPVSNADASLLVRSGSVIVASHTLDESGVVNLSADIAAREITSNVGLALEVRYVPHHDCAPVYDRMTFSVDPESTVRVYQGVGNRGGFPVLPMAFAPDFDVAIDRPEHLRYAAQAINLMGQQSTTTLRPRLATLDEAANRGGGLLVVSDGETLAQAGMQPPMLTTRANVVGVNGTPTTSVDIHGPLGVVQAFSQNGRMVLALNTTNDWGLVDRSLDYIRGLENRWASLDGDTVATGPAGATATLTVLAGGPMNPLPDLGDGWRWWTWLSVAAGAAAAITVVVVVVIIRSRRART